MDKEIAVRLHAAFEDMARTFPDSDVEFWCARDLQELLGYARWENFAKVVEKAMTACEKSGENIEHHFRAITKMIDLGKGDQALFGGKTTRDMKHTLGVPNKRPLADFLPTITIKAKDFASEITNYNIKQQDLSAEGLITNEHVKNNEEIRKLLRGRGIIPEKLPPDEDVKKVERRLQSEQKKLSKGIKRFQLPPDSKSK